MLEIACFNAHSAIKAAIAGADRIELCSDYAAGGVTPTLECLRQIRRETTKPINVMIRPRAGDFVYSDSEFQQMKQDIENFKAEASGFVFGILDQENHIDKSRNHSLVQLAAPLPCTYHRALDQVEDLAHAVEEIVDCGFSAVLTSGGQSDAVAGGDKVAELQRLLGDRITFILGGGVRSTNIVDLQQRTKVRWYHSAAITEPGETVDPEEVARLQAALVKDDCL